jgi:hypothetical protein
MEHPPLAITVFKSCQVPLALASNFPVGGACPVVHQGSATRVCGSSRTPGRFLFRKAEKLKTEKLKWVGIVCAMLLLGACTPVAEFARGYDRELVFAAQSNGSGGASPSVEYRLSRGSRAESREQIARERELIRMVTELLDEINAGKLPQGESQISNLKSQIASEAGQGGCAK